jgi:hypothetical protein
MKIIGTNDEAGSHIDNCNGYMDAYGEPQRIKKTVQKKYFI